MSIQTLSQVSSLYVVLPVLLIIFIISMALRHRQTRPAGFSIGDKVLLTGLLAGFLLLYAHLTLSYRTPADQPRINLDPLWSYRDAFHVKDGILRIRRLGLARQILLNILVMMPIGLLLPLVYSRSRHPYLLTILTGFSLSVLTETLQYFTRLGLCELDDLLHNTLGCMLGALLFRIGTWIKDGIDRRQTVNEYI